MKVSVIVPIYNTSRYLRQCLKSLKAQTLKDIEVICVNDGSTDDSQKIIDEFVAEDSRFKVIHKHNTGYGSSMNMGIRAAGSPYIGIVESDDFAEESMFQKLYEAAESNHADLVKGNYNTYCESSPQPASFEEMLSAFPYGQVISARETPKIFGVHPSVWASLYSRSFLEENDIWFQQTQGASYQDIAFAFKVNASAKRVFFIRDAVLNYRVDNADSSVHNPLKIFCVCDELNEIDRYIRARAEKGAFDGEWTGRLYGIAAWIKYRNYMWNYLRLSLPYQYAFLMKVQEELKDIRRHGYVQEVWEIQEKETLEQMTDNPDTFFKMTCKDHEDAHLMLIPVLNHTFSVRCFQELTGEFREIYIYGAGRIGKRVRHCLKKLGHEDRIKGFIVSKSDNNPRYLGDKPVRLISDMQIMEIKRALIIVAVHNRYQYEIALNLYRGGYENILLIDEKMKSWIYENTDIHCLEDEEEN